MVSTTTQWAEQTSVPCRSDLSGRVGSEVGAGRFHSLPSSPRRPDSQAGAPRSHFPAAHVPSPSNRRRLAPRHSLRLPTTRRTMAADSAPQQGRILIRPGSSQRDHRHGGPRANRAAAATWSRPGAIESRPVWSVDGRREVSRQFACSVTPERSRCSVADLRWPLPSPGLRQPAGEPVPVCVGSGSGGPTGWMDGR